MNIFSFTGRLGADCEVRYTQSGDAVVSFNCAVDFGYGDKKGTIWPRCSMFGKRGGAVSQYLLKGTQVAISGELSEHEWTDREGQKRNSLDVRVNDLTLLGKKESGSDSRDPQHRQAPSQQAKPKQQEEFGDFSDSIPF